jgi:hypothetical protein
MQQWVRFEWGIMHPNGVIQNTNKYRYFCVFLCRMRLKSVSKMESSLRISAGDVIEESARQPSRARTAYAMYNTPLPPSGFNFPEGPPAQVPPPNGGDCCGLAGAVVSTAAHRVGDGVGAGVSRDGTLAGMGEDAQHGVNTLLAAWGFRPILEFQSSVQ